MTPLYQFAIRVAENWPAPTPGAATFLHSMTYLIGNDDTIGDASADTVIRNFISQSHAWRSDEADGIKAALREFLAEPDATTSNIKRQLPKNDYFEGAPPTHCTFCGKPIEPDGKFVRGRHISGEMGLMCTSCDFLTGAGQAAGGGDLFVSDGKGRWFYVDNKLPLMNAAETAPTDN